MGLQFVLHEPRHQQAWRTQLNRQSGAVVAAEDFALLWVWFSETRSERPRKVKILEDAETMGDILTR